MLEPDALRIIVQGFADERVGAIAGHADVLNVEESWLTRMQAVRYFVAFKVVKAAESVFDAVTCCSGCFSAYRREAIMPHLDWWEHQTFLGRAVHVRRRPLADELRAAQVEGPLRVARRLAHDRARRRSGSSCVQQLRWKRSWTRESLIVGSLRLAQEPARSRWPSTSGSSLPLVAPVIAVRAVVCAAGRPGRRRAVRLPASASTSMALAYGLYYALRHSRYDALWICGVVFCFFYLAFLLWQTYYAMLTTRSSSWGTRAAEPPPDTSVIAAPVPGSLPLVRA